MAKSKKKSARTKLSTSEDVSVSPFLNWISSNYRLLCIGVLVLAALLRLTLLIEFPTMPFSRSHDGSEMDMHFFNAWGDRIADGDLLTDTIWHPYHSWHAAVTHEFGTPSEAQAREKWGQWYGGKQYHQEPLYPFLIGVVKFLTGDSLLIFYILQMLLGLLSISIIMWLGHHYFGAMAGIAAGLCFTLYSPNLLFDVSLLRTSFNTCLLLGMLFMGEKLLMGKSKPWLMGLLGGIGYILMTTSMLLWVPLVGWWMHRRRKDIKKVWQVALGFLLVISFLVARNSVTGSPLLSTSSVGPVTYMFSNFPQFEPELGFVFFQQAGKVLEITKGQMIPSVLYMIDLHDSFFDWVVLQCKKFGAVFHWYEIPNNINSYLAREYSLALQAAFIPYSFIAALGLLGMFFNFKNKRTVNLHVAVWSQIAIMVIFYVLCRFRIPMVAMLAVFAGYAIQQMFMFADLKKRWLFGFVGVALWLIIIRPFPKIPVLFESGDLAMYFHTYYHPKLNKLGDKGDLKGSADLFVELINSMPPFIRDLEKGEKLDSYKEKSLASFYGKSYEDLGNFYRDMGNISKANEYYALSMKLKAASK